MIKIAGMTRSAGMHSDQIPNSSPSLPPAKNPYRPPEGEEPLTKVLLSKDKLIQPTIFGPKVLTPNIEELRKRFQGDSQ